jgi:hypothetical protein
MKKKETEKIGELYQEWFQRQITNPMSLFWVGFLPPLKDCLEATVYNAYSRLQE